MVWVYYQDVRKVIVDGHQVDALSTITKMCYIEERISKYLCVMVIYRLAQIDSRGHDDSNNTQYMSIGINLYVYHRRRVG